MDEFPKWIYSRTDARIIQDASEYPEADWYDSPALVPADVAAVAPVADPAPATAQDAPPEPSQAEQEAQSVAEVRQRLDAHGIAYDGRWGLARLIALLPA